MQQFYAEERLHLIWGNHDMVYKNQHYVEKHLHKFFDPRKPLCNRKAIEMALLVQNQLAKRLLVQFAVEDVRRNRASGLVLVTMPSTGNFSDCVVGVTTEKEQ